MTTLRATFDGKVLIPIDPVDLPQGEILEVEVRASTDELPPGSPARLLKMMSEGPHVSSEDVDALERAIEEGKLPVRQAGIFDAE
jgi:hypothetical protein